MSSLGNVIGVDVGGTKMRAGRVENNQIVESVTCDTPSQGTEEEVVEKLIHLIRKCINKDTKSIGIGVPSVVDTKNGIVYDVYNIPSWKEVALRDIIFKSFNIPVYINNDSNCFVVGEKIFGIGQSHQNIVGMTLGTGLGLGLIMNNKLYEGRNCGAGEFGMIPYLDDCYESYCSGRFFSALMNVNAKETHESALTGNAKSLQLYNEFGKHVGSVIKSILYAYDPNIIIIGGSLSMPFNLYKESMYKEMEDFPYKKTLESLKIETSEIADSAIFGAAALTDDSLYV